MSLIIQILLLCFCAAVFYVKPIHKLTMLLITGLCLSPFGLQGVPYGNIIYIVPLCVFLSEFKKIKIELLQFNFVSKISLLMFLASLILWINSPHYQGLKGMFLILLFELVYKYFIFVTSYVLIKSENDLIPVFKTIKYCLIILTFFGILNYISKASFVLELAGNLEMASYYKYADRFRVQSLFVNPFDYGFFCLSCMIVYTYSYCNKMTNKTSFLIVMACGLFGIIGCGCRTVILCFLIAILVFLLLVRKKISNRVKTLLCIGLIFGSSYSFIPVIHEKTDEMLTMFSQENSEVGSSNLNMRSTQYAAVFFYLKDNLFFGRGRDFFLKDLGWGNGRLKGAIDKDLMGLEGIMMGLLLERGIFGVLAYLAYYISIFIFLCKKKKIDRKIFASSISLIIVFLLFGNATGELLSYYTTLIFLGVFIKMYTLEENKKDNLNYAKV